MVSPDSLDEPVKMAASSEKACFKWPTATHAAPAPAFLFATAPRGSRAPPLRAPVERVHVLVQLALPQPDLHPGDFKQVQRVHRPEMVQLPHEAFVRCTPPSLLW